MVKTVAALAKQNTHHWNTQLAHRRIFFLSLSIEVRWTNSIQFKLCKCILILITVIICTIYFVNYMSIPWLIQKYRWKRIHKMEQFYPNANNRFDIYIEWSWYHNVTRKWEIAELCSKFIFFFLFNTALKRLRTKKNEGHSSGARRRQMSAAIKRKCLSLVNLISLNI